MRSIAKYRGLGFCVALGMLATGCGGGGGGSGPNEPPVISAVTATPTQVATGGDVELQVTVSDPEGHSMSYAWSSPSGAGSFPSGQNGATVTWTAPGTPQLDVLLAVSVTDGTNQVSGSVFVDVVSPGPPALDLGPSSLYFGIGGIDTLGTGGTPHRTDSLRFAVMNVGGSSLTWNAAPDSAWLNLSPASGVTPSGGHDSVLVVVDREALASGPSGYRGTGITVTSNGGDLVLPVAVWAEARPAPGAPSP